MTLSRGELYSYYQGLERVVIALRPQIDSMLNVFASREGFLYESRVKSFESYVEKLQTGRPEDGRLADLLACSIVVTIPDDVEPCIAALPKGVRVVERRGPETRKKEPDIFRFDDVILHCEFAPSGTTTAADPLIFELQVRTLLQYAWAKATHRLTYKAELVDWRRYRLASQLRAAAEQADLLYGNFVQMAAAVGAGRSDRIDALIYIANRLEKWARDGLVPVDRRPLNLVRGTESIQEFCKAIGLRHEQLCDEVEQYLAANGYPIALTVVQLFISIALVRRWGQIPWSRMAGKGYRFLIVRDMEDLFPDVNKVPLNLRVSFPK